MIVTNITTNDISFKAGGRQYVLKPNVPTYVSNDDITASDLVNAYGNNIVIDGSSGGGDEEEETTAVVAIPNEAITDSTIFEVTNVSGTIQVELKGHAIFGSNDDEVPENIFAMSELNLPDTKVGSDCQWNTITVSGTTTVCRVYNGLFKLNPVPKYLAVVKSTNYVAGNAKIANCQLKSIDAEE